MIDMHCHILPNIDDGAKNLEESINMAIQAKKCGYDGIFATSHYIEASVETDYQIVEKKIESLNKILKEKNIDVTIYPGNEIYLTPAIFEVIEKKLAWTLNDSKYVLIEFPMNGEIKNLESIIEKFSNLGYVPIIAHPERYQFVGQHFQILYKLISLGALLQVNIGSIIGIYGSTSQKIVKKLLKLDMVHFIGTDSHNATAIYEPYAEAIKKIKKIVGEKKLNNILCENPKIVVENGFIDVLPPKKEIFHLIG